MAKSLVKIDTNKLTQYTIMVLRLSGFNVWRQNNAAVYDPTKKVYRRNSSTPGIPDIIGYKKDTGVFVGVEIKVGKDKLSKEQVNFANDLQRNGGWYWVVKTFDDADAIGELFKQPPLIKRIPTKCGYIIDTE